MKLSFEQFKAVCNDSAYLYVAREPSGAKIRTVPEHKTIVLLRSDMYQGSVETNLATHFLASLKNRFDSRFSETIDTLMRPYLDPARYGELTGKDIHTVIDKLEKLERRAKTRTIQKERMVFRHLKSREKAERPDNRKIPADQTDRKQSLVSDGAIHNATTGGNRKVGHDRNQRAEKKRLGRLRQELIGKAADIELRSFARQMDGIIGDPRQMDACIRMACGMINMLDSLEKGESNEAILIQDLLDGLEAIFREQKSFWSGDDPEQRDGEFLNASIDLAFRLGKFNPESLSRIYDDLGGPNQKAMWHTLSLLAWDERVIEKLPESKMSLKQDPKAEWLLLCRLFEKCGELSGKSPRKIQEDLARLSRPGSGSRKALQRALNNN